MKTRFTDTHLAAERIILDLYGSMIPRQKLQQVFDLNQAVRELAAARIQAQYGPRLSAWELRLRLAALWLDRETMIKVYGWDPDIMGY